ncbi:uncharacterized protein LOC108152829 [Drosophila miranda]|uniref:uncharacterized protein LOC108152829 n=1 Tax=Drosophila miranda TaxID=7229 RepID=UPI0007E75896|nr:uncharacterized protein LOC108152829 [Drosophila miranda]XP_017137922.1 uncharacterized protein LOC108152829 [Drosophila miranda]XP_033243968.1 uncharacterized protein LOC108152829 [Drosophila miranda]
MQELTRVCELNNNSIHNKVKTTATPPVSNLEPLLPIKLEHDHDLESWLPTIDHGHLRLDMNTTRLLLQGSDDPLISHGASNDAHDEDHPFKTLLARKTASQEQQQQHQQHNGTCSPLTKQQLKANLLMGNRKIHRSQATPQLPAPEESQIPLTQKTPRPAPGQNRSKKRTNSAGAMKLRFHHQALPAEYAAHYEATQGRQPPRPVLPPPPPPPSQAHENVRSWLRKIAEIQRSAERQQQKQASARKDSPVMRPTPSAAVPPPTKAPEVTLPPKRGALKYADLPYMGELTLDNYKPRRGRKPKKADICHLIYKNYGTIVPATATVSLPVNAPLPETTGHGASSTTVIPEEPLNLCLRDQSSDRYSISSGDSDKPTPTTTTATTDCGSSSHRTTPLSAVKPLTLELVGGQEQPLVASKLLFQPVGLYYQQLMESCSLGGLPVPVETIEKDNQLSLKIPIPSGFFANEAMPLPLALRKRKRSAIFIPPMPAEHSSSPSTEVSICKFKFTGGAKPTLQEKKMLSVDAEGNYRYYNGTGDKTLRGYEFISRDQQQQQQQHQQQQQQGQAPGQEKLYVDIPPPSTDLSLELLQIPPESPTSSLLLSSGNSLVPATSQHSPASSVQSPMLAAMFPSLPPVKPSTESERKRRSSRRSKQREKLEKTFKEKGFLIQTQQLQSAEGATYCKFRQLKKFTRYLFRNWKDHIPDSDLVKHQSGGREDDGVIDSLLGLESLASPTT